MGTCEAEHLQPAQSEVLDEDICHWPSETGQLIQQRSSPCWPHPNRSLHSSAGKGTAVEISLVFTFEILLDIVKMSEVFL